MQKPSKHLWSIARKIIGVFLILVGLIALLTPFTPGSWLALIGLQFLGLGFLWHDYAKPWGQRIRRRLHPSKDDKKPQRPS